MYAISFYSWGKAPICPLTVTFRRDATDSLTDRLPHITETYMFAAPETFIPVSQNVNFKIHCAIIIDLCVRFVNSLPPVFLFSSSKTTFSAKKIQASRNLSVFGAIVSFRACSK